MVAGGSSSHSGLGRSPPGFEKEISYLDTRKVTLCCSKPLFQEVEGPLALASLLMGSRAWLNYPTHCLKNSVSKRCPGSPGEKGNKIRHLILTISRRKALGAVVAMVSWSQAPKGGFLMDQRSLLCLRPPPMSLLSAVCLPAEVKSAASDSQLCALPPPAL